jgi:hypothetical protein
MPASLPPPPGSTWWNAPPWSGIPVGWPLVSPGVLTPKEVVSSALRVTWHDWKVLASLTLLFIGIPELILSTLHPVLLDPVDFWRWILTGRRSFVIREPELPAIVLGWFNALVLYPAYLVAATRVVMGRLAGVPIGTRSAAANGLRRFPAGLWSFIALGLVGLLIAIPGALAVVPLWRLEPIVGALVGFAIVVVTVTRLFCVFEALVVENERGFKAVRRAWSLTRGRFRPAVAALGLGWVLSNAVTLVPVLLVHEATDPFGTTDAVARTLALMIPGALTTPFSVALTGVLYLDLRARREPLRADDVRAQLEEADRGRRKP